MITMMTAAMINFAECPKCDKIFRVSEDCRSATVNTSKVASEDRGRIAALAEKYIRLAAIPPPKDPKARPLMGWSSWNTFGVEISDSLIIETAKAMATNGLAQAGYRYVNIDDGFFCGHDENGRLKFNPRRFPNGMKGVVDAIHALGLKAGIYSDAGINTCGSMFSGDGEAKGSGLYGHDEADLNLHFNELGFDFIKVDFCGGREQKLDVRERYTEIHRAIEATGRRDARMNICRWAFPGTWASEIAESWRTTEDIRASWPSVRGIIAENLYLSAFASAGHYNDMDMLEVGQRLGAVKTQFGKHDTGLTLEEERTHFGMWCFLSSPLLIGCDARSIPRETLRLVTNPYLIAMNQNDLGAQGYVVRREGETYVLVKDADERFGASRYVALYNAEDGDREIEVRARDLDLGGRIAAFDLAERAGLGEFTGAVCVRVPAHGAKFYRFDAEERLERTVYEGETAYLSDYQRLTDPASAGTAFAAAHSAAHGGMIVRFLGNRESNDLVWKNVRVFKGGRRALEIAYASPDAREFFLQIDGGERRKVAVAPTLGAIATVTLDAELAAGDHEIRISNPTAWAPDIDRLTLR